MVTFNRISDEDEILGQAIIAMLSTSKQSPEIQIDILKKNGIPKLYPDYWYIQKACFAAFTELSKVDTTINNITLGESCMNASILPTGMKSLEQGLKFIETFYKVHHRGPTVGDCKLQHYYKAQRKAIITCVTPYDSEFNRGVIFATLRTFRPIDSKICEAVLYDERNTEFDNHTRYSYFLSW